MNQLKHETSPYLLQHKNNPVNWYAWNNEALSIAKNENKLILVSVGYAACHWCHVMEHESFEDNEVAAIMNQYFVAIKVDREERPDIDQIYMNAAQITSGQGGWPLNVVCLPDGKPIYGATYFPKENWMQFLLHFQNLFVNEYDKVFNQADRISKGLQSIDIIELNPEKVSFTKAHLYEIWNNWQPKLDMEFGGRSGAPKFMMPNNLEFLLRYAYQTNDKECNAYIKTTLKKMAFGGVHDVLGGGFARYSVDAIWKVPHFEKMLYDNAQLLSIYAMAYQQTQRPMYKSVCNNILNWINREMTDESGGIYASLDADSEGVEGKFYCFTYDEFVDAFIDDTALLELAKELYNVTELGNFEHGMNVLFRTQEHEYFCEKYQCTNEVFQQNVNQINSLLFAKRQEKIRPNLDDKILTEWNALLIKGLVDAYKAFDDDRYLEKAESIHRFIAKNSLQADGRLYRSYKNGKVSINGFLQDYVFYLEALISLYQVTFNENYLQTANQLLQYCMQHFYDDDNKMFYITSDLDEKLIVRSMDSSDNVIPAANSQMAKCLLLMSKYFEVEKYYEIARAMLNNVLHDVIKNASFFSNWAIVLDILLHQNKELVIVGIDAKNIIKEINQKYLPNILIAGSVTESSLPLTQHRFSENETLFFLCENKSCQLPVKSIIELDLK
jgi:hypothetical protein